MYKALGLVPNMEINKVVFPQDYRSVISALRRLRNLKLKASLGYIV
jgi:hypothetical protein